MSEDLIQALRRVYSELKVERVQAAERLMKAQHASDAVDARYQAFRKQLRDVCSAAGFSLSAVIDEHGPSEEPDVVARTSAQRTDLTESFLALPSRPRSQRWYAGQALHRLGSEASIAEIAEEMRRMGYEHRRSPARSDQLEQSLAALPSQVAWVEPGDAPGRLRLALEN